MRNYLYKGKLVCQLILASSLFLWALVFSTAAQAQSRELNTAPTLTNKVVQVAHYRHYRYYPYRHYRYYRYWGPNRYYRNPHRYHRYYRHYR